MRLQWGVSKRYPIQNMRTARLNPNRLSINSVKLQLGPTPWLAARLKLGQLHARMAEMNLQDKGSQAIPWGTIYRQVFLHLQFFL